MNKIQWIYVFLLSFILVIVLQSCKEKTIKTDVAKHFLNGNVKVVKTEYHSFSEKFGEIQMGPRWGWGEFYDWLFEKNGDLKEELQYNYENELEFKYTHKRNETRTKCDINTYNSDGDLDNKCVEEYDNFGKILKESYFYPNNQTSGYKTYKYNVRNQLIEEVSFNEDGNFKNGQINKYDERGLKIEEISFNSKEAKDRNIGQKTIFKYNSDRNLIKETALNNNGDTLTEATLIYNSNRNLIEKTSLNKNRNTLTVTSFSYNRNGQISEREEVTRDRNKNSEQNDKHKDLYDRLLEIRGKNNKDIYTKYDNKGNWIEQLRYKDGKPDFAIIRIIEYY